MADGIIVEFECPATPERIDQCPATPDRVLNVKTPDTATSSENEAPFINLRGATNSPPPNCAICLGRSKKKSFTDTCLHMFCFKCILEWSKVKAECPLCKQPFRSIIHNVTAMNQYDEYIVQTQQPPMQPQQSHMYTERVPPPITIPASHTGHVGAHLPTARNSSIYPHRFDVFLTEFPRFSSNLTNFRDYSTTVQVQPSDNEALHRIFHHRATINNERLQQQYPDMPSGSLGQLWRRYIYERRLYAMPVVDVTGRYRECSARFFRGNPAQVHRLMPWLNRDVVCLLRDTEHHVSYVLNVINDLLTIFNITSPDFRRRCQTYFGHRTSHFIHEFLNFARSPYDMIGYDREVRYSPYYEEVIISSSSSSSSSLSEAEDTVHIRGTRRGRAEFTIETRSNCSTFILTGTFDGQSATNIATTSRTSTQNSTQNADDSVEITSDNRGQRHQILGQSRVIQIGRNITLSSSSSDECEFVMEQKPPHLRTPELVTLNSETDSDVVFVSESKTKTPLPTPSEIMRKVASSRKRKTPIKENTSQRSWSSSSSDDDTNLSELKKHKLNQANATDESKPSTDELAKLNVIKDEYNNGASTSSGVQSGESKTNLTKTKDRSSSSSKKYYARPVRQAKKYRNMKSIYEESSSSSDNNETQSIASNDSSFVNFVTDESSSNSKSRTKKRRKSRHEHERRRRSETAASNKKKKSKKSLKKKEHKRKKRISRHGNMKYMICDIYMSTSSSSSSDTEKSLDGSHSSSSD